MPDFYQPLVGVEPFNALGSPSSVDYGGGADITQENLLISLWRVNNGIPDARIKPSGALAVFEPAAEAVGPGFNKNVYTSKYSTRFTLDFEAGQEAETYLAVLQPPRELKQLYLDPDNAAVLDAAVPGGIAFNLQKNGYFSYLAWTANFGDSSFGFDGAPLAPTLIVSGLFGSIASVPIPLLKTSGADGQAPVFYDNSSLNETVASVNTVRNGAQFYVPFEFALDYGNIPNNQILLDLRWQFSAGRV